MRKEVGIMESKTDKRYIAGLIYKALKIIKAALDVAKNLIDLFF